MEGSVLSFLRAEWKVSDTGSVQCWASSFKYHKCWHSHLTALFGYLSHFSILSMVPFSPFNLGNSKNYLDQIRLRNIDREYYQEINLSNYMKIINCVYLPYIQNFWMWAPFSHKKYLIYCIELKVTHQDDNLQNNCIKIGWK